MQRLQQAAIHFSLISLSKLLDCPRVGSPGGTVGFDVQDQVKKFGIQLTEPEAQEVVRELKRYLPS